MGVIKRQGIIGSAILYAGVFLGFAVTLYVYPKYLLPGEIGLVRVFTDIGNLIAPFLLLGMPNTYVRYFPYFKGKFEEQSSFRFLSVLVLGVGTVLVLTLFWVFQETLEKSFIEKSALLVEFIHWLPLLFFVFGLRQLLRAYYRSDFNIVIPNIYEEFVQRMLIIVAVLLYHYAALDVQWLIYLFIILHWMVFLGMLVSYRRVGVLKFSRSLKSIDRDLRREMLQYGFFVIASAVSVSMIVKIDTWMLSSMVGLESTGIYVIAMSMAMVIELPRRALTQIAVPVLATSWKNNNMENVASIYHKTSLNQMLAGGILFILIWSNVEDLFRLIPNGSTYIEGLWVVFFIALGKFIAISTGSNIEILQVSRYFRVSLYTRILLVVTGVVANFIFIPVYGIVGAALATALSYLLFNAALFLFLWLQLGLQPFKRSHVFGLAVLGVVMTVIFMLPVDFSPLLDIVLRSVITLVLSGALLLVFRVSEDVNQFYGQLMRRIRRIL